VSIRYQLDEHIANDVASALRRRGIDLWTAPEAGVRGSVDPELLAFCAEEQRVLVTDDAHFAGLHQQGRAHAGIVFCPRGSRSVGHVVRTLMLIHAILEPGEIAGALEFP
jgi:predicted nuclease of predicted toxin-antitoxin system